MTDRQEESNKISMGILGAWRTFPEGVPFSIDSGGKLGIKVLRRPTLWKSPKRILVIIYVKLHQGESLNGSFITIKDPYEKQMFLFQYI